MDRWMYRWMDVRTGGRMEERKKKKRKYWLDTSMYFKIRLSYIVFFYKCCSSNLSVMIKEDTVMV